MDGYGEAPQIRRTVPEVTDGRLPAEEDAELFVTMNSVTRDAGMPLGVPASPRLTSFTLPCILRMMVQEMKGKCISGRSSNRKVPNHRLQATHRASWMPLPSVEWLSG